MLEPSSSPPPPPWKGSQSPLLLFFLLGPLTLIATFLPSPSILAAAAYEWVKQEEEKKGGIELDSLC